MSVLPIVEFCNLFDWDTVRLCESEFAGYEEHENMLCTVTFQTYMLDCAERVRCLGENSPVAIQVTRLIYGRTVVKMVVEVNQCEVIPDSRYVLTDDKIQHICQLLKSRRN